MNGDWGSGTMVNIKSRLEHAEPPYFGFILLSEKNRCTTSRSSNSMKIDVMADTIDIDVAVVDLQDISNPATNERPRYSIVIGPKFIIFGQTEFAGLDGALQVHNQTSWGLSRHRWWDMGSVRHELFGVINYRK